VQQWLAVYFSSQFKFSQFLVSMLITLTSLSGIFGEVIGGYLSDKIGRLKTVNFGIMCMVLAVFFLLVKPPVVILALLMILWGLGWTFNHVSVSAMLTDLPKEFLNEAASLNSGVRFLSGGIGTGLSGIVMQGNYMAGFLVWGVCLIVLNLFTKNILRLNQG
jgi:predicted MFS family arabinose efflux permease